MHVLTYLTSLPCLFYSFLTLFTHSLPPFNSYPLSYSLPHSFPSTLTPSLQLRSYLSINDITTSQHHGKRSCLPAGALPSALISLATSMRCGAVRCGAVRCGAVRCGAVRWIAPRQLCVHAHDAEERDRAPVPVPLLANYSRACIKPH